MNITGLGIEGYHNLKNCEPFKKLAQRYLNIRGKNLLPGQRLLAFAPNKNVLETHEPKEFSRNTDFCNNFEKYLVKVDAGKTFESDAKGIVKLTTISGNEIQCVMKKGELILQKFNNIVVPDKKTGLSAEESDKITFLIHQNDNFGVYR